MPKREGECPVRKENIQTNANGEVKDVNLEITAFKVTSNGGRPFLIMFEDARAAGGANAAEAGVGETKPSKEGRKNAVIKAAT